MVSKAKSEDIKRLLDCARAQRADRIGEFLKNVGLRKSGTKVELVERLREYLEDEPGGMRRLTERLNELDGWGNQHVYLYKTTAARCRPWRKEAHVKKVLRANNVVRLLNSSRSVVLPDEPTLAAVQWSPSRIRFIWNEGREWYERRDDKDYDEEGDDEELEFRAWQRKVARGTIAFDWDLTTAEAMVMIQRLPSGAHYAKVRDEVINLLHPFVDLTKFDVVRISPAVKKILDGGEVKDRKTDWEGSDGGKATFASSGKGKGVRDHAVLKQMEAIGKKKMQARVGNMYWLPTKNGLASDFHTVLLRKDQRIGIFGQKPKNEVRYVIGRIRSYCT